MLRDESGEALPSPPPRFHPHFRLVADAAMEFDQGRRRSTTIQTKEKLSFAPVQRRRRRGRRRRLAHLADVRNGSEARLGRCFWAATLKGTMSRRTRRIFVRLYERPVYTFWVTGP